MIALWLLAVIGQMNLETNENNLESAIVLGVQVLALAITAQVFFTWARSTIK